ncbi:protein tilB homolog [Penaeus monodon]|uniref:protein tilB homolog n=1 Tax=Penaeus monodon TaxID=6687 RepID=UPI0018A70E0C|nr:protein tilB homolog [Penaeus monodon]
MGKITVELVRKRAEHNEGELSTLEEISLHQQDIEKIEHLHRWCPRLRILYLQGNLISKIENLGRLRELEYLNLALNNIEVIEGLGRCESLRKLDLTANFVSELTSILSLQDLPNLKELMLRTLLHLKNIGDAKLYAYKPSKKLNHLIFMEHITMKIKYEQKLCKFCVVNDVHILISCVNLPTLGVPGGKSVSGDWCRAEFVKSRGTGAFGCSSLTSAADFSARLPSATFAVVACGRSEDAMGSTTKSLSSVDWLKSMDAGRYQQKRLPRLFTSDGRPLNANAAKVQFDLKEDEGRNAFVLEVHTYRYLDASQVQCDVEPWYVRVLIRGKVLQLVLLEEVRPGQSTAQRSQVTGHLLVTMPKLAPPISAGRPREEVPPPLVRPLTAPARTCGKTDAGGDGDSSASPFLEISKGAGRAPDYRNIVGDPEAPSDRSPSPSSRSSAPSCARSPLGSALFSSFAASRSLQERPNSPGFCG